jgi:hypothetical protein
VRGFADQRLRNPKDPLEASNRRISIIVQYLSRDSADDAKEGEGVEGSKRAAKNGEGAATEGTEHTTPKND